MSEPLTVRNEWNPKPHLPKIVTERSDLSTLFRNQNPVQTKPQSVGDFTKSMLDDRIDLKDENCLTFSLCGK
jgi:hypothetical protein